jgi:conjugative relaxase-like TrwC/TraI family protein
MLSIQTLGTMTKDKVAYYTELAATGYYTEAEEPAGQYFGKLASVLNLDQKAVTQEDLLELAKGFDTKGKALVANAGDEHRMGIDLTFSAPKSVSVCFGLAGTELRTAIQKAHESAVKAALTYAEQHFIQVRHGFEDNQQRRMINTGNALFALFEHGSSRSNDPLLHTHAVLLNFSQVKNGEFRCLEAPDLFNYKKALGALYRAELANQLEALGLKTEADEEFFKVTKVPDELCKLFSKRSNEIHDLLQEGGFTHANAKLKQNAALFTRQAKTHQSREALYKRWKFEAEQLKTWTSEQALAKDRNQKNVDTELLLESLTEKKSLFTYPDFLEQVFIHFQHAGLSSCEAEEFAKATLASKAIRRIQHSQAGVCYTTEQQYQLEMSFYKEMTEYSKGAAIIASLDSTAKASASFSLNTEQLNAFQFICRGSGNLALVNGAPGTGKSYLFNAVREAYRLSGHTVIGCSLAATAAEELQKSSGINAQTIDSLLIEIDNGRKLLKKNSVIVVDEAGMVGVKKLKKLLDHAKRTQSKLVLVRL